MEYNEEFKENIFNYTIEGIVKLYGYSIESSTKLVNESELDKSILLFPNMIAHCSQEQLVDLVI